MFEHFWTAVTVLEVVYVLLLSTWILLEKRSPAATLAWILGLMALPVAGFFIYFLIGPQRLRRRRLRRLRAQQAIARPERGVEELALRDPGKARDAAGIARIGQATNRAVLSTATDVDLLVDGASTYAAILDAVRGATHHVHVLYYIFEPDRTGRQLRDALIERARAGVKVRVVVDAVGSVKALRRRFFAPLAAAGGQIAYFNRLSLARFFTRLLNFRNHRKIVVVDGRVGFTGGINVTDNENTALDPEAWRDTHLCLRGPCVAFLQLVFLEDWCYVKREPPPSGGLFADFEVAGERVVQILDSGPDKQFEPIKNAYFAAINAAKEEIQLSMAYFVPDEPMLFALKSAAMRGVTVRVLLSKKTDSRTVSAAARSYYDELLAAGVRIFEYQPRVLHAKTLVVDDWFAAVGTSNFDARSFRLNFEVSAVVYGSKLATELAQLFEEDLTQAKQITQTSRAQLRLLTRLGENTARLLSPLL